MFENDKSELNEHLVTINRVAKVVKGGRRFGFAAIMIVGDNKGRVGVGTGKAKEVPEAVRKATENAKSKMIRVNLKENRTIHHDIVGRFGAGKVILRSASPGTGIIAGGPMRALFESLGIKTWNNDFGFDYWDSKHKPNGGGDLKRTEVEDKFIEVVNNINNLSINEIQNIYNRDKELVENNKKLLIRFIWKF